MDNDDTYVSPLLGTLRQSMPRVAKLQKRLMCIPLVWCWWSLLRGVKLWTLTGPRANSFLLNG